MEIDIRNGIVNQDMAINMEQIIKNSLLYRVSDRIYRWSGNSVVIKLLDDETILIGLLSLFLVASLLRVLASDIHVAIQFLSFALMFVVLLAITWRYTEPLADL